MLGLKWNHVSEKGYWYVGIEKWSLLNTAFQTPTHMIYPGVNGVSVAHIISAQGVWKEIKILKYYMRMTFMGFLIYSA